MEKSYASSSVFLVTSVFFFFFLPLFHGGFAIATETQDASEDWGYVEVRPSKLKFIVYLFVSLNFVWINGGIFPIYVMILLAFSVLGLPKNYRSPYVLVVLQESIQS